MPWSKPQRLRDHAATAPERPGLYEIGYFRQNNFHPMYIGMSEVSIQSRLNNHYNGRGNKSVNQHITTAERNKLYSRWMKVEQPKCKKAKRLLKKDAGLYPWNKRKESLTWSTPLNLWDYSTVPEEPGLYEIGYFRKDNFNPMYIGMSEVSIRSRLSDHYNGRGNKSVNQYIETTERDNLYSRWTKVEQPKCKEAKRKRKMEGGLYPWNKKQESLTWSKPQRLRDYAATAPARPGLYEIGYFRQNYFNPMYIGMSEVSIQSRLNNHYNGRGNKSVNQYITTVGRDNLYSRWTTEVERPKCEEAKMLRKMKDGFYPWNKRKEPLSACRRVLEWECSQQTMSR